MATKEIGNYAKTVVGALLAGLGSAQVALADGHITQQEWVSIAIATLGVTAGVYVAPNVLSAKAQVAKRVAAARTRNPRGQYEKTASTPTVLDKQ